MMLDRRGFLLLSAAGFAAGCAAPPPPPPGPAVVSLAVAALPGSNPSPDGSGRPVVVGIYQLRAPERFEAADFFELQESPEDQLGGDLVAFERLSIPAGGGATRQVTLGPDAPYLGVAAFFRDPSGRVWRSTMPVAQGTSPTAEIRLGPAGLALSLG